MQEFILLAFEFLLELIILGWFLRLDLDLLDCLLGFKRLKLLVFNLKLGSEHLDLVGVFLLLSRHLDLQKAYVVLKTF